MTKQTTMEKIKARPWVESVDDERGIGNSIIVMLRGVYCYEDDPGCGTMGFDTWADAERGTRVDRVYEPVQRKPAPVRPLTDSMRRELLAIHKTGEPGDPAVYHSGGALAFYARDKVLSALLRRELIRDEPGGFVLTDAGRAALGLEGRKP